MNFSYKQIWLIAYPILISLLMEHMINVTDTAFLGHVGEVELGASALAGVLYMAIYMLGFGFSIGVQILIARKNGERKYGEIGGIFMQGAFFLLALAAVMFFLCDSITIHILSRLISSDQVYAAASSYLEWRRYGLFFSFIAILFRAFYIGITETRTLTLNSIVMVLSNIVFNYILIFGKFGFPALGIAGAAIGSSLAELVSLLFFIAIEHLGERPLAIANIMRSINTCFFMAIFAFSDTTSSMVSNLLGSGKEKSEIWLACKRAIRLTYMIGIPFLLLSALFPTVLLQIYTNSQELVQAALPTMYIMLLGYLLSAPGLVLFNAVSGTGNTSRSMKIMLITISIYVVYVVVMVMYLQVDVAIAWTSEYIYGGMLLLLSYLYLKSGNWNKRI